MRVKCRFTTTHTAPLGISHWGRKRQQFYGFVANRESARDVYSKLRIIAVTKLEIVEWHNYKHLYWIIVRRDDDKLYKFKEGDSTASHTNIEDMLPIILFETSARNHQEILLKLNLPDQGRYPSRMKIEVKNTERLSRSDEVLKLKNFKKDATLKLFKTNQERYEHVGPEVTSSQDGQGHKMAKKRLCLVDDLKVFKITFKTS
ncbi:hypothetical protein Tco_0471335 [Tanacetum coccineum]